MIAGRISLAIFFSTVVLLPAWLLEDYHQVLGNSREPVAEVNQRILKSFLQEIAIDLKNQRLNSIQRPASLETLSSGMDVASLAATFYPQGVLEELRTAETDLPQRRSIGQMVAMNPVLSLMNYGQSGQSVPSAPSVPVPLTAAPSVPAPLTVAPSVPTPSAPSAGVPAPAPVTEQDLSQIRILIGQYPMVKIAYTERAFVMDGQGQTLAILEPKQVYVFRLQGGVLYIGDQPLGSRVFLAVDPAKERQNQVHVQPNSSGHEIYRGVLHLVADGQTISLINHLPLEDYLYSVVACEMPSNWHEQALMAQAIAARTYAVYHRRRRINQLFDLGNTERWQVYRGLRHETEQSRLAVDRTRGLILATPQGEVAFTRYAANQDIVNRVFGGKGMSQMDAQQLALAQESYLSILSRFYPNTMIVQIPGK